jgi:hypothetical protein
MTKTETRTVGVGNTQAMEAYKITVKFFVEDAAALKGRIGPIFHSWIQQQSAPGHALIDVAVYGHVADGPGTVLVAQEANFYLDDTDGRPGLLYVRKLPLAGTFADRLRSSLRAALQACQRIEQDPRLEGRVRFTTRELQVGINDRLLAPNTDETFEQYATAIREGLGQLYGSGVRLEREPSPHKLFQLHATPEAPAPLAGLLDRLGGNTVR